MITINLLPPEYRRAHRVPIKILAATAAAVAVNATLLVWAAWTQFGVRTEVLGELQVRQDDLAALESRVQYHKKLEEEKKSFESREETLAEINANRINWTQKMDELVDVINRGGNGDKYLIWLDDLSVTQVAPNANKNKGKATSIGSVRANGHSGSPNFGLVANFFEDVSTSAFAQGFFPPAPPEGRRSSVDTELVPSETFSFTLDMQIKAQEGKAAEPKKAPQPKSK
jgi:Tfp pilus assembly protein PilN